MSAIDRALEVLHGHERQRTTDECDAAMVRGWCWRTGCQRSSTLATGLCVPCSDFLGGRRDDDPVPEQVTLERCICGGCFDCPDGWHDSADLPCDCTPDCVFVDPRPQPAPTE